MVIWAREKLARASRTVRGRIGNRSPNPSGFQRDRGQVHQKAVAAVITLAIIGALVLAGGSASALVDTSLTGDEEVEHGDTVDLVGTVEMDDEDDVTKGGYLLTLTDENGEQVELVFGLDGQVITVDSNSSMIDEQRLHQKLSMTITDVHEKDDRVGYEEVPVGYEEVPVGYEEVPVGYERVPVGYEAVPGYEVVPTKKHTFHVSFKAAAFDIGEFDAQFEIITERVDGDYEPSADTKPSEELSTDHESNVHTFRIVEDPDAAVAESADEATDDVSIAEPSDDPADEAEDIPKDEERADEPEDVERADEPEDDEKADELKDDEKADESKDDEKADEPKDDEKADEPKDEEKVDEPNDEEKADKPEDEEKADTPEDEEKANEPKDEKADKPEDKKADKPEDEEKADKPEDEKKADEPKDEEKQDEPNDEKKQDKANEESADQEKESKDESTNCNAKLLF